MARHHARKLARKYAAAAADGNGGKDVLRCARCGVPLRSVPRVVQGAVPIRCEACFGAAPRTEGVTVGDWLDRMGSGGRGRWAQQEAEELSEAA